MIEDDQIHQSSSLSDLLLLVLSYLPTLFYHNQQIQHVKYTVDYQRPYSYSVIITIIINLYNISQNFIVTLMVDSGIPNHDA